MVVPLLKENAWRSEPYRRFVASQKCFGCGIEGYSQCAHANEGKGLGIKSSDDTSFPLCGPRPGHMGCHAIHDLRLDGLGLEEQRAIERGWGVLMREIAAKDGWVFPFHPAGFAPEPSIAVRFRSLE